MGDEAGEVPGKWTWIMDGKGGRARRACWLLKHGSEAAGYTQ